MIKQGLLIILSGPSGTGKGTVAKILAEEADYALSVSRTTRLPRPGEIDGIHYHFTTKNDFIALIEKNGFFEYAEYNGKLYGTPIENVEQQLSNGFNVILEIEVKGAKKIMDTYNGEFISVFMLPPSVAEMKKRLLKRGTETLDVIEKRLSIAKQEVEMAANYNYLVVNDTVLRAVTDIKTIIAAERLKITRNEAAISNFKEETL